MKHINESIRKYKGRSNHNDLTLIPTIYPNITRSGNLLLIQDKRNDMHYWLVINKKDMSPEFERGLRDHSLYFNYNNTEAILVRFNPKSITKFAYYPDNAFADQFPYDNTRTDNIRAVYETDIDVSKIKYLKDLEMIYAKYTGKL